MEEKIDNLIYKIDKILELQLTMVDLMSNLKKKNIKDVRDNENLRDKSNDLYNNLDCDKKILQDDIEKIKKNGENKELKEKTNNHEIEKKIFEDVVEKSKIYIEDENEIKDKIEDIIITKKTKKNLDEDIIVEKKSKKNINNIYVQKINEYIDLKREYLFDFDDKFIKDCLNMNNLSGDIKLFKKMYIDNTSKEYYSIRHIQKNLQFWLNNKMNDDDSQGTYIKNIIIGNIVNCYLKVNILENYSDNIDQFLKNQQHINKILENKYKDNFLNKIIPLISI